MNAKEILRRLKMQPFQPFVVVTSSGDRYLIRHPENAILTEGGILYIFEPIEDAEAQAAMPHTLSLLHITTLERLSPEKAA